MKIFLSLHKLSFAFFLVFSIYAAGQVPSDWQDDSGITTFKESGQVHEGNFSCGILVNTGTQADCDLSNLVSIPVVAGENFKISFWYFTSQHVRLRAAFDWNDGNATYSDNYAGPTASGNWEEFVYEGFVPADVTSVNLRIRCYDVSGFVAPETQFVDLFSFESPLGNVLTVTNGDFESWPSSLPEPSNYPSNFEASALEQQISLTWTDA
ncbi:MAG: hypothetical protein K9H16_14210, partial [Bacteroidales bacterium]|nr:hypothetical protein [Bacteroidales bacterium]